MNQNNQISRLENQSIICFAPDPWESMWRNRHQIMSRLALNNKVLYIEPGIPHLRQAIKFLKRSLTGKRSKDKHLRHIGNGLWVFRYPDWAFGSNRPALDRIGLKLRAIAISIAMQKLKLKTPILWVVNPRFWNVIKYFKKSTVCYQVVDNYAEAPYFPEEVRKELEKTEKTMLSLADLVIVTSPFLLSEKSKYHNNVHLVRNAVDYKRFAPSLSPDNIPKDMEQIPKPIIGYVGVINKKLDLALLDAVARKRPQWSFVFIGDYYDPSLPEDYSFINSHSPNVFLLGRRDVKEVPRYIHACNVCMLPYCRNDYTKAIDSLKLYEYFACEKPVVATDIPAIQEYKQLVYVANDADDFIAKLESALKCFASEQRENQRAIAMQNTWDKRVEQISAILNSVLIKKEGVV